MVSNNKISKSAVATTAAATFGVAMTSMYLAPEMQADVLDITWNGGNPTATAPISFGTLNVVSQDIDQVVGSRNFIQFNDQFGGTGRTFDCFLSTYLGGNVSGLVSVTNAVAGDVIDPGTFAGITSGALGGGTTFDGTGSAFIAFRETGTGNVGWFRLEYTTDGDIFYGPGEYGSMGETLTVGGTKMGCTNPLGDVNLDGVVTLLDVSPFVALLTGGGFQCEADVNEDGVVSLLDVNPFVQILTGG